MTSLKSERLVIGPLLSKTGQMVRECVATISSSSFYFIQQLDSKRENMERAQFDVLYTLQTAQDFYFKFKAV